MAMAQKERPQPRNARLGVDSGSNFLVSVHCYRLACSAYKQLVVDGVRSGNCVLVGTVHTCYAAAAGFSCWA